MHIASIPQKLYIRIIMYMYIHIYIYMYVYVFVCVYIYTCTSRAFHKRTLYSVFTLHFSKVLSIVSAHRLCS
jgi:hypothetical protein